MTTNPAMSLPAADDGSRVNQPAYRPSEPAAKPASLLDPGICKQPITPESSPIVQPVSPTAQATNATMKPGLPCPSGYSGPQR